MFSILDKPKKFHLLTYLIFIPALYVFQKGHNYVLFETPLNRNRRTYEDEFNFWTWFDQDQVEELKNKFSEELQKLSLGYQ